MATDLIGYGSNAPNVLTNRPADTRTFGPVDTWGKDCSSLGAGDGTGVLAGFMNGFLGQARALIRGNGQTAALADIIPVNNADDTMMLRAIQQLIQRGQPRFGIDTGAADALVVALTPALAEYKGGTSIKVLVAASSTGAPAFINVNGLGERSITRKAGLPLQPLDMLAGSMVTLDDDGTKFQLADMPAAFTNRTQVVASSGNFTLTASQYRVGLQRTTSPATTMITLPTLPNSAAGQQFVIEDLQGNFNGFPVTVVPPAGTISGHSQEVLDLDRGSWTFTWYGNNIWSVAS
jgi:hypothetical protein